MLRISRIARGVSISSIRFNVSSQKIRTQLYNTLSNDIVVERENYRVSPMIANFLKQKTWSFVESKESPRMTLSRSTDGFKDDSEVDLDTEFILTVTNEKTGSGLRMFCCTTPRQETSAFAIGNVKYFKTLADAEDGAKYPGPDFEDLDATLMTALDKWLESLGVDGEVCEFVTSMATDKEQREYMLWLENVKDAVKF